MINKEKIEKYVNNFCWVIGILINIVYGVLFFVLEMFALLGMFNAYFEENYYLLLVYIVTALFAISFRIWNEKKLYY